MHDATGTDAAYIRRGGSNRRLTALKRADFYTQAQRLVAVKQQSVDILHIDVNNEVRRQKLIMC